MITSNDIDRITGSKLVDSDGDKVGTVKQVYVDAQDGHPLFATVNTGFFGTNESFVPLETAEFDGETLRVAYDKATIKAAPNVADDGDLDDAEQDRIFDHYGLGAHDHGADTGSTRGADRDSAHDSVDAPARDADRGTAGDQVVPTPRATDRGTDTTRGHDTSGPTTDDAMTRSEERLHVGTQQVESGRARLRKHIVTEQQTVSVPTSHDEVRVEREPITDANVASATGGPTLSEEEHEVVLTEEVPDVTKDTVPVERVKLGTERVAGQQSVTEDVRKEQIELDGDGTTAR